MDDEGDNLNGRSKYGDPADNLNGWFTRFDIKNCRIMVESYDKTYSKQYPGDDIIG